MTLKGKFKLKGLNFGVIIFLNIFYISLLCLPKLWLFYQKYNKKNSNIVKYYYNLKYLISIFNIF